MLNQDHIVKVGEILADKSDDKTMNNLFKFFLKLNPILNAKSFFISSKMNYECKNCGSWNKKNGLNCFNCLSIIFNECLYCGEKISKGISGYCLCEKCYDNFDEENYQADYGMGPEYINSRPHNFGDYIDYIPGEEDDSDDGTEPTIDTAALRSIFRESEYHDGT